MKKFTIALCIFFLSLLALAATPTFYGLSGLTFLPGARIAEPGSFSLAMRSVPAQAQDLTIHPLSFAMQLSVLPFLELGLTNTYQYYLQHDMAIFGNPVEGSGFRANSSNIFIPVIPSLKFSFLDESVPNGAIAIGFLYPLGAFFCFDYSIPLPADYGLYFLFGFGTTVETLTPFIGGRAELPFGLDIILEGSYSGMTDQLTSAQEIYFSTTIAYELVKNSSLDFTFRIDQDLVRRAMISYEISL